MTPTSGPTWGLNQAVDGLIASGCYAEALALPRRFVARGSRDTASELLVQINLAEAEYNLGRWSAAWERLRGLDPLAAAFPIARAGLSQQRAWIAAHTGRPDQALHHWGRADRCDLPRRYHAEHFFTGAVALIGAGRFDAAYRCALGGLEAAIRPSSKRNALFIRARVAAAAGDWVRAESLCRAASAHPYRAQGGDGLLLWGEALTRLERFDEARHAYALAVERDRQSESAQLAAERLRQSQAVG
ncbi:MAG TPA: tetratricopeptide repeat protein [Myxococcales bacterium]|nr:tetratricopeptide repeat protein [Myxococcales bacterium]